MKRRRRKTSRSVRSLVRPRPPRAAAVGEILGSHRSIGSALSTGSMWSLLSVASIASAGSVLSIGSAGSILSIGSAGSILSVGSAGSILSVGSAGAIFAMSGQVRILDDGREGGEAREPRLLPIERGATLLGVAAVIAALRPA